MILRNLRTMKSRYNIPPPTSALCKEIVQLDQFIKQAANFTNHDKYATPCIYIQNITRNSELYSLFKS